MTAAEFKLLIIPNTARMYRTAFSLTGNAQEAEDMVQEAFIRLWTRRDRIPPIKDIAAYCNVVTHNVCMDAIRRKQIDTSGEPPDTLQLSSGYDASYHMEASETARQLEEAIGKLPQGQQQILRMHVVDDRSITDIQAATGLTTNNIRVMLSRARQRLKTLLHHERE